MNKSCCTEWANWLDDGGGDDGASHILDCNCDYI